MLKLIRFYFKWLSFLTPNVSSELATRIFYTPQRSKQAQAEVTIEEKSCKKFIETSQGNLKTLLWSDSNSKDREVILLAHGWGGRGTQLYKFIQPLLEHCDVLTFDGPAHGDSPGKMTTLPKYALALADICKQYNVSYVIGHSFGAGATAIAVARQNVKIKRAVFIASPYSVENVVNNFCQHFRIPKNISESIHRRMETSKWHGLPREDLAFSSLGPKIQIPVLMFHSKDDPYIHYSDGQLT